ncbi:MAG: hypothetical protein M0C28_27490 [Candidatus Moduliflexus flocculans]|nr:hypothetical protein [Candidatus Moduliflexus flocculans]
MDKTFSLEGKTFPDRRRDAGHRTGHFAAVRPLRGAESSPTMCAMNSAAQTLLEEAAREDLGLTVCRADLTSAKGLAKLDKEVETALTDLSGLGLLCGHRRPPFLRKHDRPSLRLDIFVECQGLLRPGVASAPEIPCDPPPSWSCLPREHARSCLLILWSAPPRPLSNRWPGTWPWSWRPAASGSTSSRPAPSGPEPGPRCPMGKRGWRAPRKRSPLGQADFDGRGGPGRAIPVFGGRPGHHRPYARRRRRHEPHWGVACSSAKLALSRSGRWSSWAGCRVS